MNSPQAIIQFANVARGSAWPKRSKMTCWRYKGKPSAYLLVATNASVPGEARLFGMGCGGKSAVTRCCSQHGQAYFFRTCLSTRIVAGTISNCSDVSSPMQFSGVPSCGQILSVCGISCTISTRGKSAGNARRPRLARSCAGTSIVSTSMTGAACTACSASSNNRNCGIVDSALTPNRL